jgi:hypothetical protein
MCVTENTYVTFWPHKLWRYVKLVQLSTRPIFTGYTLKYRDVMTIYTIWKVRYFCSAAKPQLYVINYRIISIYEDKMFVNRDNAIIYDVQLRLRSWAKIPHFSNCIYSHDIAVFKSITRKNRASWQLYEFYVSSKFMRSKCYVGIFCYTHARQYLYKNSYYVLIRLHGRGGSTFKGNAVTPLGAGPLIIHWDDYFMFLDLKTSRRKNPPPARTALAIIVGILKNLSQEYA